MGFNLHDIHSFEQVQCSWKRNKPSSKRKRCVESVLDPNPINNTKIEMKKAMNHANKCKSTYGPIVPTWKILDELKKWTKPEDMTAMYELQAYLSKVK